MRWFKSSIGCWWLCLHKFHGQSIRLMAVYQWSHSELCSLGHLQRLKIKSRQNSYITRFLLVMMFGNTLLMSLSFDLAKLQKFGVNKINPLDSSTGTQPLPKVSNCSEKCIVQRCYLMFVVSGSFIAPQIRWFEASVYFVWAVRRC